MSIFSNIGDLFTVGLAQAAGFFSAVKNYILLILSVLLVLVSIGFYVYYNVSQTKLQNYAIDVSQLKDAVNTEKQSFDTLKNNYVATLQKIKDLSDEQQQALQREKDLQSKLANYDLQKHAVVNAASTEKDVNKAYSDILSQLKNVTVKTALPGKAK